VDLRGNALLDALNSAFNAGRPSNRMADAGVLVRQFDRLSEIDAGRPWIPCTPARWCARYHSMWPSSLINRDVRLLYYPSRGGLVLDASAARFFCIYYGECVTGGRTRDL
jgi:hypothetical protein